MQNIGANGLKNLYVHPSTDGLYPKNRVFHLLNGESQNKNVKNIMNISQQKDPKTGRRFVVNEQGEPMTL